MEANYQQITDQIKEKARELLSEEKIDRLIAFGLGRYTEEATPVFIRDVEDVERLIFDENCTTILSKYLLSEPEDEKIGIVLKPCDSRALATYIADNLVNRDNIVVIGINGCPGVAGNTACDECEVRNAVIADVVAGEKLDEEDIEIKASKLEAMDRKERKQYFQEEFSRCTRCYSCREACPVCYCEECFVDSNRPFWVGRSTALDDNFTFHLMRSMHMAGRCVNCGACEMACPEGIDVRALAASLNRAAEEIFDYQAGMDPEQKTLLSEYNVEDREPGFLD